jgi:hypothetical protein
MCTFQFDSFHSAGFAHVASPDDLRVLLESCVRLSGSNDALPVVVLAVETRTDLLFLEE